MYRIFINETVLILSQIQADKPEDVQIIENQNFDIHGFFTKVQNEKTTGTFALITPNPEHLFKKIRKSLILIKAAGGLVENSEGKYLFIFRRGKWDLPKGKVDEGEKVRTAAVREVEEECGIRVDTVLGKICDTWHIYKQDGRLILKKTYWYKMELSSNQELIPQLEEDITEARWLGKDEFPLVRQNTFPLILDVIRFVED